MSNRKFEVGDVVIVKMRKKNSQLNGMKGIVHGSDGRFTIDLGDKRSQPEYLVFIPELNAYLQFYARELCKI